jgi:hypothetical protein
MDFTKDRRERTPKEQAGNLIASLGGLMRAGPKERAIAAALSDLMLQIAEGDRPQLTAFACSRALSEFSQLAGSRPDHARDLAKMGASRARMAPTGHTPAERDEAIRAGYRAAQSARRVFQGPKVRGP